MDEKEKVLMVPYIVYEGAMARAERKEKRLVTALIVAIVAAALITAGFLLYLNQYDFVGYDYEITQDGQGINNAMGYMGGITFGAESESEGTAED